jgi:hypothetical protein
MIKTGTERDQSPRILHGLKFTFRVPFRIQRTEFARLPLLRCRCLSVFRGAAGQD